MAMLQMVTLLCLVMSCCSSVSGWFFTRNPDIARARGKPIDQECLAHGTAGRCEFYSCFEKRLPCGDGGYMLKFGVPYCEQFQQSLSSFNSQGQAFINATSRCLTEALVPYYDQNEMDCHRLSHAAFDAVSTCYTSNGFCDVVEDNVPAFAEIFQPEHLFQTGALKIWREILEVTYQCDPDRIHNFANSILRGFSQIIRFLSSD